MLIGVGVVIPFQIVEPVLVVHRQTIRTTQPGRGGVTHPIETLQPRAVGEMKASDRILSTDAGVRGDQITRTPLDHFFPKRTRRGRDICGGDSIAFRHERPERW